MPKKETFIHKLLGRMDRIDRESIEAHFFDLVREIKRYENVLNQFEEGVILIQLEGKINFINSQAAAWLGIYPQERRRIQDLARDREYVRYLDQSLPDLKE